MLLVDQNGEHPAVPAAEYSRVQENAKGPGSEILRRGGVPYTCDLQPVDCARVANWFHTCVPGAQESTLEWLGQVPGCTCVYYSHRTPQSRTDSTGDLWQSGLQ